MGERVVQLTGLRALSIAAVLVTHLWTYPEGYTFLNRIAAAGWLGVQLSFVLSGFLITKILWRAREGSRYFVNFYARRSLRIFPLYYLVLATVFLVLPLVIDIPAKLEESSWMYWLYLSNFAVATAGWQLFLTDVTWSLAVEEQFYLVWPALVRRITRSQMIAFCLALIVLAPIGRALLWSEANWMWIHMMMPLRADAFAVGALLIMLPQEKLRKYAAPVLMIGGAVLLTLILTGNFSRKSMLGGTIGYSLVAFVAGAGLIMGMNAKAFTWKPLVHMGTVSYGIYLLHPFCLMLTSSLLAFAGLGGPGLLESVMQVVVTGAVAVAVATVSYRLFESPILKLKRFFESNRTAPAPAAAVAIPSVVKEP
ncbi:acyltransferase [Steroidobacter sp. S1-65]|uniref:Acyltransferase n=1 Tax=Steroidobacter gossypii TaxID=2805490 RepID=A0ABS1WR27_9GAMM|nr:acyltransferase [Steroidobacter gossypii]MBM0103434.1 acyltransferase [Steroidobacter gossypii]